MKRHPLTKALTLMLSALLLAACGTALILPASAKDVSVSNGTGTREAQFITGDVGYRAKINTPFTGFGLRQASMTSLRSQTASKENLIP